MDQQTDQFGGVLEQGKPDSQATDQWGGVLDEQQPQRPEPAAEPLNMKGFKQRLSDLWERGRIDPETAIASSPELRMGAGKVGEGFREGFKTGFGEEEIGLSDEQIQQIKDLGLGPGGSAAYAYLAQQYKYGQVLFRGIGGLYRGGQ